MQACLHFPFRKASAAIVQFCVSFVAKTQASEVSYISSGLGLVYFCQ